MDVQFSSLKELYERLQPALRTKSKELKACGYDQIKMIDIWDYLSKTKWRVTSNLGLNEMVSDILNCEQIELANYLKGK